MDDCFAEVLRRETAHLAAVADVETLRAWRRRVVDELLTPRSPYVRAMSGSRDAAEADRFLDRWQELIAEMIHRVLRSLLADEGVAASPAHAQEIAALILATLHGGSVLSRVAQCAEPLESALDLALAPLLGTAHLRPPAPEAQTPLGTMGSR